MEEIQIYRTIQKLSTGEITEKKSRFLSSVIPVSTKEEAEEWIGKIKKKNFDARHNCYAYRIGSKGEQSRYSDDGEPSGTAGRPIMEILEKEELTNVLIVVTRYFGGILLGTGGLVRAYTQAAKEGISHGTIIQKVWKSRINLTVPYPMAGRMKQYLMKESLPIINEIYTDSVTIQTAVPVSMQEQVRNSIVNLTTGVAEIEEVEKGFF